MRARSLRIEAFAPEPLWVETLLVRRSDAYVGATLRAFQAMFDEAALESASRPTLQLVAGTEL